MLAVLLAAGRGKRMGALTARTPKPLLRLRGRPILEHILTGLRAAGVDHAVIVTGHLGGQIESRFGDGATLGLHLDYRRQANADGTAPALLLAEELVGREPFLLSWGDVIVAPSHYRGLIAAFRAQPCDVMLSLNRVEDPWRGAAVYVDPDLRVTALIEKPPRGTSSTPWNNAGIFVFGPRILDYARRLGPSSRGEYELPQAVAAMIEDDCLVRGYPVEGFWSDLGTPADLAAAELEWNPESEP